MLNIVVAKLNSFNKIKMTICRGFKTIYNNVEKSCYYVLKTIMFCSFSLIMNCQMTNDQKFYSHHELFPTCGCTEWSALKLWYFSGMLTVSFGLRKICGLFLSLLVEVNIFSSSGVVSRQSCL